MHNIFDYLQHKAFFSAETPASANPFIMHQVSHNYYYLGACKFIPQCNIIMTLIILYNKKNKIVISLRRNGSLTSKQVKQFNIFLYISFINLTVVVVVVALKLQ